MKVTLDGKTVRQLEFHRAGEDGEFLWIRWTLEDGSREDSYYLKGSL